MAVGFFGFSQHPFPLAELTPGAKTKRCIKGQARYGQKVFSQE